MPDDISEIIGLDGGEPPSSEEGDGQEYHTILQVWREVLKNARTEQHKKVTPQWANRIVTSYRGIEFQDMNLFRNRYFTKVLVLLDILEEEIETDEQCLTYTSAEEDVQFNSNHYLHVLTNWQVQFLQWELHWDCSALDAATELASLSEVHRMFFADQALTTLLDSIGFQYTDENRTELVEQLEAVRKAEEGR